jgi:hypothetical protein
MFNVEESIPTNDTLGVLVVWGKKEVHDPKITRIPQTNDQYSIKDDDNNYNDNNKKCLNL